MSDKTTTSTVTTTIFIYFFLLPFSVAKDCPIGQPFTKEQVNPTEITKTFKENPKMNTVGDLLCCLPDELKKRPLVVTRSASLQQGLRVFFGNYENFNFMFSVSAENDPQALAKDNIEFLVQGETTNQTVEIDIMSSSNGLKPTYHLNSNPDSCLACHGSLNPNNRHLRRSVVNSAPWFFSNSSLFASSSGLPSRRCPNIVNYLKISGKKLRQKFLNDFNQVRFRCIDQEKLLNGSLSLADDRMAELPTLKILERELKSKEQELRHFVPLDRGFKYGCISFSQSKPNPKNILYFKNLYNWLPAEIVKNQGLHPLTLQQNFSLKKYIKHLNTNNQITEAKLVKAETLLSTKTEAELENPDLARKLELFSLERPCLTQRPDFDSKIWPSADAGQQDFQINFKRHTPYIQNLLMESIDSRNYFMDLFVSDQLGISWYDYSTSYERRKGQNLRSLLKGLGTGLPDLKPNEIKIFDEYENEVNMIRVFKRSSTFEPGSENEKLSQLPKIERQNRSAQHEARKVEYQKRICQILQQKSKDSLTQLLQKKMSGNTNTSPTQSGVR